MDGDMTLDTLPLSIYKLTKSFSPVPLSPEPVPLGSTFFAVVQKKPCILLPPGYHRQCTGPNFPGKETNHERKEI